MNYEMFTPSGYKDIGIRKSRKGRRRGGEGRGGKREVGGGGERMGGVKAISL